MKNNPVKKWYMAILFLLMLYNPFTNKGAIRPDANFLNEPSYTHHFKTEGYGGEIIRCEAENAAFSGERSNSAQTVNDPYCSGGKYVETRDDSLMFSFTVTQAGNYKISAKIRASSGYKVNKYRFDGDHTLDLTTPLNNLFEEFIIVDPYYFSTGNHTIEMLKSWGHIQIDYLELNPSSAVPVEFDIQPLVTPQPSANTVKLYQFLLDNFQHNIISGVMTGIEGLGATTGKNQNEINWVQEITGKEPALMGLDFVGHTGAFSTWKYSNAIADAITWHNRNGFVTFSWHWRDPTHNTAEFYTERTNFDARKIFEPQSAEYAAMIRDMDIVANLLKTLQEKDIPVLWRPLHEASGGWFWWGAQGPEACKQIWHIMFDRFVHEHGLKNLIWVWTSEANDEALKWYPGDEYVDIIGADIYEIGNHRSQMLAFQELKRIYNGKKMLTLSECASIPSMETMKKDGIIWLYYLPWNGEVTKDPKWNTTHDWISSMSDPYVITLDKMPANKEK